MRQEAPRRLQFLGGPALFLRPSGHDARRRQAGSDAVRRAEVARNVFGFDPKHGEAIVRKRARRGKGGRPSLFVLGHK